MNRTHQRNVAIAAAGLVLAATGWSAPARALDPGTYTVRCASAGSSKDGPEYTIRMDMVDLLTLKNSFGAIISGVRQDDGRRVILTGDHGCALIGAASGRRGR